MIHHILSKSLRGSASPKSFNNEIGVPLTLLAASAGDQYVSARWGRNAPGEIDAWRASPSRTWRDYLVAATLRRNSAAISTCQREGDDPAATSAEGGPAIVWG